MHYKEQVRQSFNHSAYHYDEVAAFQNMVALDLLTHIATPTKTIIDLGCGTGFFTEHLAKNFPESEILAIDFAAHMLQQAQKKISRKNICWLCADAEYLPITSHTVDCVTSNLMLQWSNNLEKCLTEMHRILKPGGYLFFSSFAPGSLSELDMAWQQADHHPHVHHFISSDTLTDHFVKLKFTEITITKKSYTLYYPDALTIMRNLKTLGASNRSAKRSLGLTTPKKLSAAISAYETFRDEKKGLPISYEIYFGVVKK